MSNQRENTNNNKRLDYKDIPTFILEDVPVLNEYNNDVTANTRVGGDPYPQMAKPRRSFGSNGDSFDFPPPNSTSNNNNSVESPPIAVSESNSNNGTQPVASPPLYNSTPYRSISQQTAGYLGTPGSAASVESSTTSYHTAYSSPGYDNSIMSSPFAGGDTSHNKASPRERMAYYQNNNLNRPIAGTTPPKVQNNTNDTSVSTTPQHMKYPKHFQSHQELKTSNYDSAQGLAPTRKANVEHPRQVSSPSVINEQKPAPPKVPSIATITWKANDPNEWTIDRVVYWLEMNKFGPAWTETFRSRNICGEQFLALSNYQNLKKLGHFYTKGDDYDTSPSRFIHLLRKLLNRSSSSNSLELALQEESNNNNNNNSNSERTSTEGRPSLEDRHSNYSYSEANSTSSPTKAENNNNSKYLDPNNIKPYQANSEENLLDTKMPPPQRRQNINHHSQESRPVSSVENSSKSLWHVPSPSSPSFRHHGFFRRHHKSSSSESSVINNFYSNSTSNLLAASDTDDKPLYSTTTNTGEVTDQHKRSKGFLSKLRRRENRYQPSKEDLGKLYSPPSPVSYMNEIPRQPSPSIKSNDPYDFVEGRYRPIRPSSSKRIMLITTNNETFTSVDITDLTSFEQIKDRISSELNILTWIGSTFHLTEFGCTHGEAIDHALLSDLIFSSSGPSQIDPIKLFIFIPQSTKPIRSPGQTSLDSANGNPQTPSYMILNPDEVSGKGGDYFSTNSMKKPISNHGASSHTDKPPPLPPKVELEQPSSSSSNTLQVPDSKMPMNNNNNEVKKKKSDDMSLYRPTSPQNAAAASAAAVASSVAVPITTSGVNTNNTTATTGNNTGDTSKVQPSLHTQQVQQTQPRQVVQQPESQSSSSQTQSQSTVNAKSSDDSFKVIRPQKREINFDDRRSSPYDRKPSNRAGKTTNLVALRSAPPPPMNRQSSVKSRNFSGSSFSSTSSHEKQKLNINTDNLAPSSFESKQSLSTYSPGTSETLIPRPYSGQSKNVIRKPVSRGNSPATPTKEDENFLENDISFEGAPEFIDDEDSDSSDSGLWAKKPPSSSSKPDLRVETVHSSEDRKNNNSDNPSSEVSPYPMTKPDWAVRPTAEVVYDNLEDFFPNTDLDKPIIAEQPLSPGGGDNSGAGNFHPALSPVVEPREETKTLTTKGKAHKKNNNSTTASAPPPTAPTVIKTTVPLKPPADDVPASNGHNIDDHPDSFDSDEPLATGGATSIRSRSKVKSIRVVAREAKKRESKSMNSKGGEVLRRRSTKVWGKQAVEVTLNSVNEEENINFKQFMWVKGDLIGKGTFGKVYLALNVTTREMMAVKQVEVPQTDSDKASSRQREVVEALHSEVETMKDLDHLNIVQYLGFEALPDVYNLFLEYVPGGSVGRILQMYGRFDETLIKSLTRQVLDGLSYLHSRGILHRDLKADNLLLDIDGVCKISDFGISKKSRNIYANDAEMSMQGTIFWMAPEVIQNVVHNEKQGYSAKVDVWSLGCVVLEMFAGRRPWSTDEAIGAMYKLGTSRQAPPIPDDTKPFVSKIGKHFLDECFTINPDDRPTAQRLLQDSFCIVPKFNFTETPIGKKIRATCKKVHTSGSQLENQEQNLENQNKKITIANAT